MPRDATPRPPGRPPQPEPLPPGPASPGRRLGGWLPALLGALCFANTLLNGFTYDDDGIITRNPRVRNVANFREIWLRDWWFDSGDEGPRDPARDRLYRPLTFFTFALQYAIHGLNAPAYHLVNVALHALACWLVWRWTLRLLGDEAVALTAALLFAVHPVHVEAVASVVGRAEVLAAVFLLAGCLALLPERGVAGAGRTSLAAAAFLVALLAKETAICYLAIALLLLAWNRRRRGGSLPAALRNAWILLVPLAVYFPLRMAALEQHLIRERASGILFNPLVEGDAAARILGPFTILGHYARLMFFPRTLSCDYGLAILDHRRPFEPITLLGFLAAAALLAGAVAGIRALRAARPPAPATPDSPAARLGLLTLITLASYALISNTVLLIGVTLAERLAYWLSVPVLAGVAVAVHAGWSAAGRRRAPSPELARLARFVGIAGLATLGLRSLLRNFDWQSNATLFTADTTTFPGAVHLSQAMANLYLVQAEALPPGREREELLASADRLLDNAVAQFDRYARAYCTRGQIARLRGDLPRARQLFSAAIALNPSDSFVQRQLASTGDPEGVARRIDELQQSLASDPGNVPMRVQLCEALVQLARYEEALAQYQQALVSAPQDVRLLRGYAQALLLNLQQREAAVVLRRVLQADPDDWESHANLATITRLENPRESLEHAEQAFRLKPDDARVRIGLAEALVASERVDDAIRLLETLERNLPKSSPLHSALADRLRELRRERR